MADIFLSYSHKDKPVAARIQAALAKAGYDVFWDQKVPAGRDWDSWIRDKLTGASLAVVLWSKTSVASQNVRHEALIAEKAGKLFPVLVSDLPPENLPMGQYMVQSFNLPADGIDALVSEIGERLRPGQAPLAVAKKVSGRSGNVRWLGVIAAAVVGLGVVSAGYAYWVQSSLKSKPSALASTVVMANERAQGSWRLNGQTCDEGPVVTEEDGKLTVTVQGVAFMHAIESADATKVATIVVDPDEWAGNTYEFKIASDGNTMEVARAGAAAEKWERCS